MKSFRYSFGLFAIVLEICAITKPIDVRLTDGQAGNQGRVEVRRHAGERWGKVCDMNFGENEAAAVCRQLNYKYSRKDDKVFIPDYPDYQLENFRCEKNESYFSDCISDEWKTGFGKCHPKDNAYASVCCSNSSTFGETHDGIFISHCADTWIDAEENCEEKKATIASLNEYKQIIGPIHTPALNSDSDKKVYWTKSFFTPWIWSNGCFKFTTETFEYQEFNLDNNTAQACLQMCSIESQPSSFLLSGQFCRCFPTQSLKSNLEEVLPGWCNRKCLGDTLFFCGSGLSGPDSYWSLYTIESEDTFYRISDPHTNQHKQCAILESSRKLSAENCYKRVGYICGQIFPGNRTLPKLMFFQNSPFYKVYMQEARIKCTNDDNTMRLIGENILKQDVRTSQPIFNLWVDISRVLADAYSIYWDPINTGDKSLWRNLEPRWCRATRQGDMYFSDEITACSTRLRYICSMAGSVGGQTGTSISTTVNPGDGMTTNAIITTDKNEECLTAGVIAAIVIAFFTVGVLIGVALTWVNLSRKQIMKGRTEQNQHQTSSISRETELNVSSHLPNTYEQLQSRADTENNLAYDSLHANTSAAQDSHSQYESLNQGAGTSHTYEGLEYNR